MRSSYNPEFGHFVKERRGERTQIVFAGMIGMSMSYLSRIETGLLPPQKTVRRMATNIAEDPHVWLAAAGYEAESNIGPLVSEVSSPAPEQLPTGCVPVGSVERDGLILLAAASDWGNAMTDDVWLLVSADVLGELRRGDMVHVRGAPTDYTTIPSDTPVIIREADGTQRLVQFVSATGASVRVRPWSSLGQAQAIDIQAEIIAKVDSLFRSF